MNELKDKINEAIAKKAVGYNALEVIEEYQDDEGTLKLTKKKVTKKHFPPDTQAAKMVIEQLPTDDIADMTDEELEREKQRLLKLLKEEEDEN